MKKKNLCQKQSCLSANNNFLCEHHRKKWFLKPAHKQINTYRPITDPQLDRPHLTFRDFPCKETSVWNQPINSILMTCHHPNLDSASDWLQPVPGSQNEIVGKIEWGRQSGEEAKENVSSFLFLCCTFSIPVDPTILEPGTGQIGWRKFPLSLSQPI